MKKALFVIGFFSLCYFIAVSTCHAQATDVRLPVSTLTLDVPPPRYLPKTGCDNSLTHTLWVTPTQFIQLPQGWSNVQDAPILSITDMETGKQTPLQKINAVIHEAERFGKDGCAMGSDGQPLGVFFSPYQIRLSPDGRWLVFPSCDEAQPRGNPIWVAMTLDGRERRDWPRHAISGVGWMRDSTHFVEISEKQFRGEFTLHIFLCSLDTPEIHHFPLDKPQPDFLVDFPGADVFFTENGCGWIMNEWGKRYEIVPGTEHWSLRSAPMLTKITLAEGDQATDWALSPSGDWLVWRDNSGGIPKHSHTYISRPDGTEARIIFVSDAFMPSGYNYGPQWTADEQGIVFKQGGFIPELNGLGSGLYLISLSQSEAKLHPQNQYLAKSDVLHGPFPTAKTRKQGAELVAAASPRK